VCIGDHHDGSTAEGAQDPVTFTAIIDQPYAADAVAEVVPAAAA